MSGGADLSNTPGVRWSTIEIKCPHHHTTGDPFLMRISTLDGKQNFTEFGEGGREEWVGDFDSKAVSLTPEGDVPHFRLHFECARPSCSYDEQLRSRSSAMAALQRQLFQIWEHRLPDRVINDYPAWLRMQPRHTES